MLLLLFNEISQKMYYSTCHVSQYSTLEVILMTDTEKETWK